MGVAQSFRRGRHHTEREAVDDDRSPDRQAGKRKARLPVSLRSGVRKPFAEIEHVDVPAETTQLGDDPRVIRIAAGRSVEAPRNREGDGRRHHTGASYQARAEGDSPIVTRTDAISRPLRPSSFARTASATLSNTCLVKNS